MKRFLARLNYAFKAITQPNGTPYTPEDVMVETNQAISASYLRRLLAGHVNNPSIQIVEALSTFFQVEPSYFLDTIHDQPQEEVSKPYERLIPYAEDLSEKEVEAVIDLINIVKRMRD